MTQSWRHWLRSPHPNPARAPGERAPRAAEHSPLNFSRPKNHCPGASVSSVVSGDPSSCRPEVTMSRRVGAIILVLILLTCAGLLVPWIKKARESGDLARCHNNLKQI